MMLENNMFVSPRRIGLLRASDSVPFHYTFGARNGLDTMFHREDGGDRLIMAVLPKTLQIGQTTRVWPVTQKARISHCILQIKKKASCLNAGSIDLNRGIELESVPVFGRVGLHEDEAVALGPGAL